MCGRFLDPNLRNTEVDMSQIKLTPFPRRFNVKPMQDVVILAKTPLEPIMARWWLVPSWQRGSLKDWKATTFNARSRRRRTNRPSVPSGDMAGA